MWFMLHVYGGGATIFPKPGKKKLQHIYKSLHKKLQVNNKKNLKKLTNL